MAWNVVIVGGGFGGLYAARRLEQVLPPQSAHVTLITDVNFLLYTPLLPGAAAGTLEPRHVVIPVREELHRTEIRFGRVTGMHPASNTLTVDSVHGTTDEVHYDQVILAPGSAPVTRPSSSSAHSSSSRSGTTTCRGSSVPAAAPGRSGV